MVYHYNNHFKNYSLIEGLIREKLYVTSGKKLNKIYFFNFKKKYFKIFKNNYIIYKKYLLNYEYKCEIEKYIILNETRKKKKELLLKAYKFLNKSSNITSNITSNNYEDSNLSNIVTNYLKNKYIFK